MSSKHTLSRFMRARLFFSAHTVAWYILLFCRMIPALQHHNKHHQQSISVLLFDYLAASDSSTCTSTL